MLDERIQGDETFQMDSSGYDEDRTATSRLAAKLRESAGKEGVYYIVRFPSRWRLYAFPWEDSGDRWGRLATLRSRGPGRSLTRALDGYSRTAQWWKGFPRGRIERSSITKVHIESAFELGNSQNQVDS